MIYLNAMLWCSFRHQKVDSNAYMFTNCIYHLSAYLFSSLSKCITFLKVFCEVLNTQVSYTEVV